MESNQSKEGSRRQRTPEEIIKLLQEFDNSEGITVSEFCQMHDVSDATYYNWRKMHGSRSREEKPAGFIELIESNEVQHGNHLFAEVKGIKLYQPVAPEYLKALAHE